MQANDYVSTTIRYLRNYNLYQQFVTNTTLEIEDIKRRLAEEPLKIANYGTGNAGGASELTCTESSAEQRLKLLERIQKLAFDLQEVKSLLNRIDRSMAHLSDEGRTAIVIFYMNNNGYEAVARKLNYSVRWSRTITKKAVEQLAIMLFGISAEKDILFIKAPM